jgi:hypothetical protein
MSDDDRLSAAYRALPPPEGHLSEEAWERLLDGAMTGPEREQAVEHVTRCAECAQVHRGLAAFTRASADLHDEGALRRGAVPVWRWAGVAAAAVAALSVALWRTPGGSVAPLPSASATAIPAVSPAPLLAIAPLPVRVAQDRAVTFRGREEDSRAFLEAFDHAVEPYRERRYGDAAARLAALGKRFPSAPEPPLYEGVALLMAGRAAEAADRLGRAERLAAGTEWAADAGYHAARARLAAGRDEGRAELDRLCASPGPYQKASCDALSPRSPSP